MSAAKEGTVTGGGETLHAPRGLQCGAQGRGVECHQEDSGRAAEGGCSSWAERLLGFWDTVSSQRERGEAREHLGRLMQSRGEAEAREGGVRAEE